MTTYHLQLTASENRSDAAGRTLAALDTEDETVMAATLRSLADRLDPPQPRQPVYRDRFRPEGYGADRPVKTPDAPDVGCPSCRTILNARAANCDNLWHSDNKPDTVPKPPTRRNLVTPDGCGHEHTYGDGCALAGKQA